MDHPFLVRLPLRYTSPSLSRFFALCTGRPIIGTTHLGISTRCLLGLPLAGLPDSSCLYYSHRPFSSDRPSARTARATAPIFTYTAVVPEGHGRSSRSQFYSFLMLFPLLHAPAFLRRDRILRTKILRAPTILHGARAPFSLAQVPLVIETFKLPTICMLPER